MKDKHVALGWILHYLDDIENLAWQVKERMQLMERDSRDIKKELKALGLKKSKGGTK